MTFQRTFTDAEIEDAISALNEPGRLDEAQRIVEQTAPALKQILSKTLAAAEWFGSARNAELRSAVQRENQEERLAAVSALCNEEINLGMLVGVAIGFELSTVLREPN
jgi:hypothetical protein